MNKLKNKYLFIPLASAILSLAVFIIINLNQVEKSSKLYINFLNDITNKNVSTVYLTNSPTINIKLKDGSLYTTDNPRTNDFKDTLLKNGIKVSESQPFTKSESIPFAGFIISLAVLAVMSLKNARLTSPSKLSVDSIEANAVVKSNFNFSSIAGNDEAKESVKDIVDFLKNPEKYTKYGARMPKGLILYGEPGTGKTLLAKAVAGEAGVPFYAMSGSDFIQVYVGVGASRIRQLFKKARSNGKAVIFIDEIDAIGKKRDSSKNGGSDERDQTLNALLTEMSGFNEKEGIIIMAATNRMDMLDPALLRPGRFDRHIEITLPDINARKKIFSLHLENKPALDIDIEDWSQKTAYFSGAKIESLVNEAAILACKEDSEFIENKHLDKAFSIVLAGHEKINRDYIKDRDKKITAYHEAGHAIVSLKVLSQDKISKITIIPSSKGAGGYTLSIPQDNMYQNKDYLTKKMMVLLGGRAAEELIFGFENVTTGAFNDIKTCSNIVFSMVTQYGMGETLGLLNLQEFSNILNINTEDILKECKNIVNMLYNKVKNLLISENNLLESLSKSLIEKETLYYDDLIELAHNKK